MGKYVAFAELPEKELAIGKRIKVARRHFGISQEFLASLMSVTRDQLNNVEIGRVALRFLLGWRLCQWLDVNPLWVASGEGDMKRFIWMHYDRTLDRELFSDVMSKIRISYSEWREIQSALEPRTYFEECLHLMTGNWQKTFGRARMSEQQKFLFYVAGASDEYVKRMRIDRKGIKHYLGNVIAIPLSWVELRRRLRAATAPPGAKAALARQFEVSTAAVSQWLSGANAPAADTTLRLLEWVVAEEAKQQKASAGSASTQPAPKTQKSKSTSP